MIQDYEKIIWWPGTILCMWLVGGISPRAHTYGITVQPITPLTWTSPNYDICQDEVALAQWAISPTLSEFAPNDMV